MDLDIFWGYNQFSIIFPMGCSLRPPSWDNAPFVVLHASEVASSPPGFKLWSTQGPKDYSRHLLDRWILAPENSIKFIKLPSFDWLLNQYENHVINMDWPTSTAWVWNCWPQPQPRRPDQPWNDMGPSSSSGRQAAAWIRWKCGSSWRWNM